MVLVDSLLYFGDIFSSFPLPRGEICCIWVCDLLFCLIWYLFSSDGMVFESVYTSDLLFSSALLNML